MQQGFRTELQRIAALGAFLLIAGAVNGHLLITLLIGGSVYMIWTLVKIHRLYRWLDSGARGLPPEDTGVWGDISDNLYRLQQRNERSKRGYRALAARIRMITSALDVGILVLNHERILDWWNPAATDLLGLRGEDRGQHITNLIRDPRFVRFIQQGNFDRPLELSAPGDSTRIIQYSAGVFGDNEMVLAARDITKLRHLEQMRKDFVANISHELRTPLTVLTGYIETLKDRDDQLPAPWAKALQQMDQQTGRLNSLTEDLVLLSQLESTPATPAKKPVNLCELLKTIVESARVISAGRHTIKLECHDDLTLPGESRELYSAFSNLVYNAIRHNPDGCEINVRAKSGKKSISVKVADNGRGIDPRHLPRLTERFYRADQSRASQSGGTGLGLAIVKHVLLRHNGRLEIRSTLGKGSIFSCRFAPTAP